MRAETCTKEVMEFLLKQMSITPCVYLYTQTQPTMHNTHMNDDEFVTFLLDKHVKIDLTLVHIRYCHLDKTNV